jgi:Fic family protein
VPAEGHEKHYWKPADDGYYSRSARARATGPYESAIPATIAGLEPSLPVDLSAEIESAAQALSSFDHYAALTLGAQSSVLGPMSTVLLRTESTSSSQIENLTVGARRLALESLGEGRGGNAAVVVGNVRAMEAALSMSVELSEHNILTMHQALLCAQHGWENQAGKYRDQLVWVGTSGIGPRGASHVAPQADLVPACMHDLIAFISRDDLPVIAQCAIAHAQFETIHPFADGNGRVGRALVHAILRNKGLTSNTTPPVSAGLLTDTEGYFAALEAYRRGDARPIVECFANASRFAASSGRGLIDSLAAQIGLSRSKLAGIRKDSGVWRVLPYLIAQPIVNAKYLIDHCGMSKVAVGRALRILAENGVVVERTGGKRNMVWEHAGILEVLDDYAEGLRRI